MSRFLWNSNIYPFVAPWLKKSVSFFIYLLILKDKESATSLMEENQLGNLLHECIAYYLTFTVRIRNDKIRNFAEGLSTPELHSKMSNVV